MRYKMVTPRSLIIPRMIFIRSLLLLQRGSACDFSCRQSVILRSSFVCVCLGLWGLRVCVQSKISLLIT